VLKTESLLRNRFERAFFGRQEKAGWLNFLLTAKTDFAKLSVLVADLVFENRIAVCVVIVRFIQQQIFEFSNLYSNSTGEFDPGSERTLAACLTHASRTE
jgi:hypothetical protein